MPNGNNACGRMIEKKKGRKRQNEGYVDSEWEDKEERVGEAE